MAFGNVRNNPLCPAIRQSKSSKPTSSKPCAWKANRKNSPPSNSTTNSVQTQRQGFGPAVTLLTEMATIEQEIGLMDDGTFEGFVHQVLLTLYPSAGVKKVDGSGGDRGIDAFQGVLANGPAIWQCKRFAHRIGRDQKRQIVSSIETALKDRHVSYWTLCLSIDLREPEHCWFQSEVVAKYSPSATIDLIQRSDLVGQVIKNNDLARFFFPESAIANLLSLEGKVFNEGEPSESKEALQIRAERYLRSMIRLDRRLSATVINYQDEAVEIPIPPKTLFAVREKGMVLCLAAKDHEALERDPIRFSYEVKADSTSVLEHALNTGRGFSLPTGSIVRIGSSSPLIQALLPQDPTLLRLEAQPVLPTGQPDLFARLIAGRADTGAEIPFIRFQCKRIGLKEITFEGEAPGLTVTMVIIPSVTRVHFSLKSRFKNLDVRAAAQVVRFLAALEETGIFRVFNLATGALFYEQHKRKSSKRDTQFMLAPEIKKFIENAKQIADFFKVPIALPADVGADDLENAALMQAMISQTSASDTGLTMNLVKRDVYKLERVKSLRSHNVILLTKGVTGKILGSEVETGPISCTSETAHIVDIDTFLASYMDAQLGESVALSLHFETCSFTQESSTQFDRLDINFNDGSPSINFMLAER